MHVDEAIRSRVSVREYADAPVPGETLRELLELAVLVPNHRMTEPLRFRVMSDDAKRAYGEALGRRKAKNVDEPEVAEQIVDKVVRERLAVPAMIGVLVHEHENPEIREEDYATAFMAIQNVCLAAVARGLGTHIKTGAVMAEPSLREALDVPDDHRLAAIVFLGEPATVPAPKERTPAAEVTEHV
ncbi:MAG: nitroreductase family protein [Candidatus Longimicrobiales bacterium M2_2A_002]